MSEEKIEITQEQIDEWKAQYGKLFKTVFGPYEFYWHPFTRKSYNETMSETTEMEIEDEDELLFLRRYQSIVKNVVYPDQEKVKEILDSNYGILETFPNLVLEKSGFFRDETSEL